MLRLVSAWALNSRGVSSVPAHPPFSLSGAAQAYLTLEELVREGKLRRIGLSNYTIEDYEELKSSMTIKVSSSPLNGKSLNLNLHKPHLPDINLSARVSQSSLAGRQPD